MNKLKYRSTLGFAGYGEKAGPVIGGTQVRFLRELRMEERSVFGVRFVTERVEDVLGVEVVGRPVEGVILHLAQKFGPVGTGHFNHHLSLGAAFLNVHQLAGFLHERVTASFQLSTAELAKPKC